MEQKQQLKILKSTENELLRKSTKFKEWRQLVFKKDNYRCICGNTKDLHPHHILFLSKYPEIAYNVDNGQTLCIDCHQEIHYNLILSENLTGKKATKL